MEDTSTVLFDNVNLKTVSSVEEAVSFILELEDEDKNLNDWLNNLANQNITLK